MGFPPMTCQKLSKTLCRSATGSRLDTSGSTGCVGLPQIHLDRLLTLSGIVQDDLGDWESVPLLWQLSIAMLTSQLPRLHLGTAERDASGALKRISHRDRFAIVLT